MQIRNPHDEARYLPALEDYVPEGGVVDLPEDVAVSLVDQGWQVVEASKAELAAAAAELGVDVKKSWNAARIQQAIDEHLAAQAEAAADAQLEPGPPPPDELDTDPVTTEADPAAPQED